MIAPKIIDKNTVTASNVANTSAEVGRMRLRSSRRAEADKPVQEHKQVLKICIYSSNLSKYSPSTMFFFFVSGFAAEQWAVMLHETCLCIPHITAGIHIAALCIIRKHWPG